ncbi:hypothetical protein ACIQU2_18205 [Pseudomonas sp. NPDC098740]|uniref:hypothetical protein n=1 Tax=Pseudomonas sp. NPDC098740 TaxID=3364486 RepID=UPI00383BA38A
MTTDTQVLPAPVITEPEEGERAERRHRFMGTGKSGAEVVVTAEGSNVEVLRTIVSDGKWSGTPDKDLPEGTNRITASQRVNSDYSIPSPVRTFTVK